MYFERFPFTFFSLDDRQSVQLVKNIFLRLSISEELKNNYSLYDEYDILDGETPEILADKMYGGSNFHWIILHMNDILDPRFDWPLTSFQLKKYCEGKYDNIDAIHHYENADGQWVNSNYPLATPISNFAYEEVLNEQKRRIKLLKPQYVEAVSREFTSKLENING
jgi:hypothetical protein